MLKKIKPWQIIIFTGLLLIVIGGLLIPVFSNGLHTSNNDNISDDKLLKLLENDYLVSKALYGGVSTDESSITVDDLKYDIVTDKKLTSLSDLQNIINETYDSDFVGSIYADIDKYNKYIEIDDNLYVNINSICKVNEFDNKIVIVESGTNEITVENNGKKVIVKKDNSGNFKLTGIVYKCV